MIDSLRTRSRGVTACLLVLASLKIVFPEPAIGRESAPITLDQILQVWQDREAAFRSGTFVWKEVRFLAKGGHRSGREPFPPQDVTHKYQRSFMFEGGKLRYSANHPGVWAPGMEFFQREEEDAWDGRIGKSLVGGRPGDTFDYRGHVVPDRERAAPGLLPLRPILAHYWPSRGQVGSLRRLSLTGRRGKMDISSCIVLEGSPGVDARTGVNRSIWLDPQRGYIVRRWMAAQDGKSLLQTDVFYSEDPGHGWVPSHWKTLEHRPDGTLRQSIEATVVEQSINTAIEPEAFQLEFPPGTLVTDLRVPCGDGDYQKFVIRPNGTKRIVLAAELARGATLQELFDTPPGQAGLSRGIGMWKYLLVGSVFLLALFGATRAIRTLRRRAGH